MQQSRLYLTILGIGVLNATALIVRGYAAVQQIADWLESSARPGQR